MTEDPLPKMGGSAAGRKLFQTFARASDGYPVDDVIAAAGNMIANCLRQHIGSRREAEAKLVEIHNRVMAALMEHYDPATDRRRSVVPFSQVISPAHVESQFRAMGLGRKGNGRT